METYCVKHNRTGERLRLYAERRLHAADTLDATALFCLSTVYTCVGCDALFCECENIADDKSDARAGTSSWELVVSDGGEIYTT